MMRRLKGDMSLSLHNTKAGRAHFFRYFHESVARHVLPLDREHQLPAQRP